MRHVAIVVCALLLTACGGSPNDPSGTVEYRVTGVARASLITFENVSGTAQVADVALPWTRSRSARAGDFLYVSAQNAGSTGCISVQISRNGSVFASNQSCGAFVIATASGTF